jgi:hypothetical protein
MYIMSNDGYGYESSSDVVASHQQVVKLLGWVLIPMPNRLPNVGQSHGSGSQIDTSCEIDRNHETTNLLHSSITRRADGDLSIVFLAISRAGFRFWRNL